MFFPTSTINYGNPVNWSHPLNRGLVSWWKVLPQRAGGLRLIDLCGKNHGTLVNGTKWAGMGRLGGYGALNFDGVNDYVDGGTLGGGSYSAATLCFWGYRAATNKLLFTGFGDTNNNRLGILVFTDSKIYWEVENGGASFPSTAFTGTGWHYYCLSWPGGATRNGYVDGVSQSVGSGTNISTYDLTGNFNIGQEIANSRESTGQFDDVRIYNRALSAAEVAELFHRSRQFCPGLLNRIPSPRVYSIPWQPRTVVGRLAESAPVQRLNYGNPVNKKHSLNRGILSWWKVLPQRFGGLRLIDLCGKFHGTLTNGTKWAGSMNRPGGLGSLQFDGTDDLVDFGTGFANFATADKFTISGWLFATTVNSANHGIIGRNAITTGKGWRIRISASNTLRFGLVHDASNYRFSDTAAISANTWYHVVGTWDGTSAVTYLNGRLSSTPLSSGNLISPTLSANLYLGYDTDTNSYFAGHLDDWGIVNRALSAREAAELYSESRLLFPNTLNYIPGMRVSAFTEDEAVAGRTTKNTRSHPLGVRAGINWRVSG